MPKYPMKMTIQPAKASKPGLALPNRQWRRLGDGSIEVIFNTPDQLRECIEATEAIRKELPHE